MEKEKCIVTFNIGEFYWECGNFVPYIIWKRLFQYKDRKNIKFICMTRHERFDLYGQYADILIPFKIEGDETKFIQTGFKLHGLLPIQENIIIETLIKEVTKKYDILEFIYPNTSKKHHCNRFQFPREKFCYDYKPRIENKKAVEQLLSNDKKTIILAPRYRQKVKRNWNHWQELYDMIYYSEFFKKYNFVICGNKGQYIPDNYDRFLDMNKIPFNNNISNAGLLIEIIKKSFLTIGSQSAIPNISLLLGVEVLQWGNQPIQHTIDYNYTNTKVTFLEDYNFSIHPLKIIQEMQKIIQRER
jgi:hypothetical protein